MKLEKKHWIMLIAGVVVLYLVYWFFFRNSKKPESSYDPYLPIFGGGMLENNYSASMLDPRGIESGYSAMQLDPRGIESGYVRGAIKGGPQQGVAVDCKCGCGACKGSTTVTACKECCDNKAIYRIGCGSTGPSTMRMSGSTPKSTDINIYACWEGIRYRVNSDGTLTSLGGVKCNGTEHMTIL